jgi:hypothetical protein
MSESVPPPGEVIRPRAVALTGLSSYTLVRGSQSGRRGKNVNATVHATTFRSLTRHEYATSDWRLSLSCCLIPMGDISTTFRHVGGATKTIRKATLV